MKKSAKCPDTADYQHRATIKTIVPVIDPDTVKPLLQAYYGSISCETSSLLMHRVIHIIHRIKIPFSTQYPMHLL
jgi:hypothetical protein